MEREDTASQTGTDQSESSLKNSFDVILLVENIKALAAQNARASVTDDYQLWQFLKSWWSSHYNRPQKDPLLAEYTLEELLYEYFDIIERQKASEEKANSNNDKIEDEKRQKDLDWAEKMEQEEAELEKRKAQASIMEKQIDSVLPKEIVEGKEVHGEDFGEDLNLEFED